MIKVVFFDFGGVVIGKTREDMRTRLCELLGISEEVFQQHLDAHFDELMRGKLSIAAFSRGLEQALGVTDVEKKWKQVHQEIAVLNDDVMTLVTQLRDNYMVGMISDTFDMHVQLHKERGWYDLFDPLILSCEVGMRKPEKEIYQLALDKAGVQAGDSVFIDDRAEFLQVPKDMGFHVIHFQSAEQLETELKQLGVSWKPSSNERSE